MTDMMATVDRLSPMVSRYAAVIVRRKFLCNRQVMNTFVTRDANLTEDLIQEGNLAILESHDRYGDLSAMDDDTLERRFSHRVMGQMRDHVRRRIPIVKIWDKRIKQWPFSVGEPDDSDFEPYIMDDTRDDVATMLSILRPLDRRILTLWSTGRDLRDISKIVNLCHTSVHRRFHDSITKIKERFRTYV